MKDGSTIYLTTEQIEALYKLTRGVKNRPLTGVQIRSTASDDSPLLCDSVPAKDRHLIRFVHIAADGSNGGWEA